MEVMYLSILNSYAKEYANGNKAVLPAMGRVVIKLEEMGFKVEAAANGEYALAK